ncbi:GNAT family N-acetyltransferase [Streptomyces sp. MI02-7b]|uniref:GNAT family N-acetyltransferase n=1 Tax=Streptomyces sp. MI02-7b TaxID=462941 RepID=UPI0029BEA5CB|nr:GNAT family N-acetyltransferase [Streptomyces sp. MI02-7b]MDX3073972.1 GNAT family N-acetyltransferase [Streptomyces sp. MI02-7b]
MTKVLWTDTSGSIRVLKDEDNRFYEVQEDGNYAGLLAYERKGTQYSLTHTYVQNGFRGRGLGTALIREALFDLVQEQAAVTNRCPVIDRFIERYPRFREDLDLGPQAVDDARN